MTLQEFYREQGHEVAITHQFSTAGSDVSDEQFDVFLDGEHISRVVLPWNSLRLHEEIVPVIEANIGRSVSENMVLSIRAIRNRCL